MINAENIKKAITVMERVKANEGYLRRKLFDLSSFQEYGEEAQITEEAALNVCGTTCCFIGWLAISPEFRELGVEMGSSGNIEFFNRSQKWVNTELDILCSLLGVSARTANGLIYNTPIGKSFTFYGKPDESITPDDVIDELKHILFMTENSEDA